jgi:Fe-S cluster biogenesis protein NfuA
MKTPMMIREHLAAVLERGRPFLQADGADIELVAVEGSSATVRITGACATCSTAFDLSVEATLKEELPELETLRIIRGVSS